MPKIVVLLECVGDPLPRFEAALDAAGIDGASVEVVADAGTRSPDDLHAAVAGASALLTPLTIPVDAALLDAAGPGLRVVANYAVGFDNIDRTACAAREVVVCNGPPPMTEPTADVAWGLLLATIRRFQEGIDLVRTGTWGGYDAGLLLGHRLHRGTLLVVGAGRIGAAVARRSIGWEMEVLYTARSPKPGLEAAPISARRCELEDGLPVADAVVLTTALNEETRHLMDRRRLALMKPGSVLVNVSRGPVVDEQALAEALDAGRPMAAGLDVHEHEPRVHPALLDHPRAVLLPHIGSATHEDREDLTDICVTNIVETLAGRIAPFVVPAP